jgi:hypothetical protein
MSLSCSSTPPCWSMWTIRVFLWRRSNTGWRKHLFRGSRQLTDFMIFILFEGWLRGGDLNPGPLGYEPNELPDCSTPRHCGNVRHARWECQAIVQHVSAQPKKSCHLGKSLFNAPPADLAAFRLAALPQVFNRVRNSRTAAVSLKRANGSHLRPDLKPRKQDDREVQIPSTRYLLPTVASSG